MEPHQLLRLRGEELLRLLALLAEHRHVRHKLVVLLRQLRHRLHQPRQLLRLRSPPPYSVPTPSEIDPTTTTQLVQRGPGR
eukprot:1195373-Prorocentrum_minimum.AAC.4